MPREKYMLINSVKKFVIRQQLQGRPLMVALSGGADSVAMLLLLNELKTELQLNLSAVHVHHGLSVNADHWMRFCQQLCQQHDIPINCIKLQLTKPTRTSLEQVAREARYQAIGELMPANGVLFTGHHSQDQFETFVLRLMRGAGLAGLGSMRPLAPYPIGGEKFQSIQVARPLLECKKSHLTDFLSLCSQDWIEDESNESELFDRNFVRRSVLPLLARRWPSAYDAVNYTTSVLQADNDLLNEYLDDDLDFCIETGFFDYQVLNLNALESMTSTKRSALLRRFCYLQTGQAPSRKAMVQMEQQMFSHNQDAQPQVQLDKFWAMRYQHHLYCLTNADAFPSERPSLLVTHNQIVELASARARQNVKLLVNDDAEITDTFEVHFGRLTDKMKLHQNSGSKKVKQLLKEWGCPPWWRNQIPLLYNDGELVAVGDKYVALGYQSEIQMQRY